MLSKQFIQQYKGFFLDECEAAVKLGRPCSESTCGFVSRWINASYSLWMCVLDSNEYVSFAYSLNSLKDETALMVDVASDVELGGCREIENRSTILILGKNLAQVPLKVKIYHLSLPKEQLDSRCSMTAAGSSSIPDIGLSRTRRNEQDSCSNNRECRPNRFITSTFVWVCTDKFSKFLQAGLYPPNFNSWLVDV